MDLYALDEQTLQAVDLVEGWTSLIWTERFQDPGEFQLKTPLIEETMDAIPEDSFVAIQESQEIMVVENHSIAINDEGVEELTTTGRSILPWLLENRYHRGDQGAPWDMYKQYHPAHAIGVLLWNHLVNTSTVDVTGSPVAHDPNEAVSLAMIHTNVVNQVGAVFTDPANPYYVRDWSMQNGEVWKTVLDWLKLSGFGLRVERPLGTMIVYSPQLEVNTTTNKGQVTESSWYHYEKLDIAIYNGAIRTVVPTTYNPAPKPIVFRYDAGHILSPTYLRSAKGFKNVCNVIATGYDRTVLGQPAKPTGGGVDWQGFNRRGMQLDLGDLSNADIADITKYLDLQGAIALKNANIQLLADGTISTTVPYKFGSYFNSEYNLGDTVTVVGEYGIVEDMRVMEYVRSEDKDGVRAYPTLVHITT